jgi:TonB family protein
MNPASERPEPPSRPGPEAPTPPPTSPSPSQPPGPAARAENTVFAEQGASGWVGTVLVHVGLGALGLLAITFGVSPEARRRITSVVHFDAPPPPPPPRPQPPTPVRRERPRPAIRRAEPRSAPAPEQRPPSAAPPPILTAAAGTGTGGFRMPTGDNTDYRGGNISNTGARTALGGTGPASTSRDAGVTMPSAPDGERVGRSGAVPIPENGPPLVPIERVTPEYPASARANGIAGTVLVGIIIAESGSVLQAVALRGPDELREVARQAALRWRFAPYVVEGIPTRIRYVLPFPFELTNL